MSDYNLLALPVDAKGDIAGIGTVDDALEILPQKPPAAVAANLWVERVQSLSSLASQLVPLSQGPTHRDKR